MNNNLYEIKKKSVSTSSLYFRIECHSLGDIANDKPGKGVFAIHSPPRSLNHFIAAYDGRLFLIVNEREPVVGGWERVMELLFALTDMKDKQVAGSCCSWQSNILTEKTFLFHSNSVTQLEFGVSPQFCTRYVRVWFHKCNAFQRVTQLCKFMT